MLPVPMLPIANFFSGTPRLYEKAFHVDILKTLVV